MRLFTALDTPEAWRDAAAAAQEQLAEVCGPDLRLVGREQLHVTVRFLGEVAPQQASDLATAIEDTPPFEVSAALAPAGTFGSAARTSVAWLGLTIDAPEVILEAVDQAIRQAGLEPSEQPWRPHLTLARVRRQVAATRRRAIAEAVANLPAPPADSLRLRSVSLYHSVLGNRAPHHKLLARSAVS